MAFGLLETQMPQPTHGSSIFDSARNTQVNNPWLTDYWTNYNDLQNNFARDPGQYTQYRWGDTTPAPVPTTGLQGGLFANNDVYGQRNGGGGGGGNDGPMGPSNPSGPTGSMADIGGMFGGNMTDGLNEAAASFSEALSDPGAAIGGMLSGKDDTEFGGVGTGAHAAGKIGSGLSLGFSTLGGLGVSAIAGIIERNALNEALSAKGLPTISIADAFLMGLNPFMDMRDLANERGLLGNPTQPAAPMSPTDLHNMLSMDAQGRERGVSGGPGSAGEGVGGAHSGGGSPTGHGSHAGAGGNGGGGNGDPGGAGNRGDGPSGPK